MNFAPACENFVQKQKQKPYKFINAHINQLNHMPSKHGVEACKIDATNGRKGTQPPSAIQSYSKLFQNI